MSRRFNGTNQYLSGASPVTGLPLSMAAWFRIDVLPSVSNSESEILAVSEIGTSNNFAYFGVEQDDPDADKLLYNPRRVDSTPLHTTTTITANKWHHGGSVSHTRTDHRVFLDGGGKGDSTNDENFVNLDTVSIGVLEIQPGRFNYCDGQIAEAAMWNIGLSDEDFAVLATGVSPRLVRPDGLVAYWPLWGNASPELDFVGGRDLTITGATKGADRPRIFYPRRRTISFPASVGGVNRFGSVVLAASGTLASAAVLDLAGATSLTGTATMATVPDLTLGGVAVLTASGTLASAAVMDLAGFAVLDGVTTMAAVAGLDLPGSAVLDGVGTLTPVVAMDLAGASILDGVATLTTIGSVGEELFGVIALSGVGSLTSNAVLDLAGASLLDGTATLGVTAGLDLFGTLTFTGTATLAIVPDLTLGGVVVLASVSTMTSAAILDVAGVFLLDGVVSIAVVSVMNLAGAAVLDGVGTLTTAGDTDIVVDYVPMRSASSGGGSFSGLGIE